jgi:spore coat protein W
MSNSNEDKNPQPKVIPNSILDLLISDVFKKNGINSNEKKQLSNDEKEMIRNLVNDLTNQVNDFVQKNDNIKK